MNHLATFTLTALMLAPSPAYLTLQWSVGNFGEGSVPFYRGNELLEEHENAPVTLNRSNLASNQTA